MRMAYLVGIGAILGVLAVVGGCSDETKERERREPAERPPPPEDHVAVQAPPVDAPPPDAPISELHLPRHDVDANKILYSTTAEVRRILGAGTQRKAGRMRYELGDGEFVNVVYEHGKAVGIEMPTATPGWERFDAGQRAAIRSWGHLGNGEIPVRRHYVITGEPFVDTGLSIYDEEYWKRENAKIDAENARLQAIADAKAAAEQRAADAKAEKEARAADAKAAKEARAAAQFARLGRAAREGFVEEFAAMAASSGRKLGINLELGDPDTTLRVVGPCTPQILRFLADVSAGHMQNVGFTRLECANNSSLAVTL